MKAATMIKTPKPPVTPELKAVARMTAAKLGHKLGPFFVVTVGHNTRMAWCSNRCGKSVSITPGRTIGPDIYGSALKEQCKP